MEEAEKATQAGAEIGDRCTRVAFPAADDEGINVMQLYPLEALPPCAKKCQEPGDMSYFLLDRYGWVPSVPA